MAATGLSALDAVVLGLVEGITEYLPVSSTGHLLAAERLLGLPHTGAAGAALDTYTIAIQAGAIAAVLVLYRRRIAQLLQGLTGRDAQGRRLLASLVAAFVPAAVIGKVAGDPIQERLFSLGPVAGAWLVGGLVILVAVRQGWNDRGVRELTDLTPAHGLIVGLAQTLALWPGTSRSLVTILAAGLLGYRLADAVEFSFLLGLATLGAATAYAALSDGSAMVDQFGVATPLLGLAVAFVSAVAAVRWMVGWLERRGLGAFGWYRVAIGLVALAVVAR